RWEAGQDSRYHAAVGPANAADRAGFAACTGCARGRPRQSPDRVISCARPRCDRAKRQYNGNVVRLGTRSGDDPPFRRRRRWGACCMQAVRGAAMEKKLCIASMSVAGLLLLLFILDLIVGIPFGGGPAFMVIDIVGVL